MKKLLALLLVMAIFCSACVCLASCNRKPISESSDTTETEESGSSSESSASESDGTDADASSTETAGSEDNTEDNSSTETTGTHGTDASTETEQTTEEETIVDNTTLYGNGDEVGLSGIDWEKGFFSNVKREVDESTAKSISAAELLSKMQNRDGDNALTGDEVLRVTDTIVFESGKTYYGNGAAILADGGVIIKDAVDVVVKDVLIKGSISIQNSRELIFYKLDINSKETAVTIDDLSSDVAFKTCRIYGNDASVTSGANNVTVYKSYVRAQGGLALTGDNVIVQNCKIIATDVAVSIKGSDCVVRENTVMVLSSGEGIRVSEDSMNALVALNDIQGVQKSITVESSYNCSVIKNRAISIHADSNTNLYVIDNNLGGYIRVENNNYLICDGNRYTSDGLDHSLLKYNNANVNGDGITDVNARPDVGANEDLLPHTNKELFVGMERKKTIADASFTSQRSLGSYISACGEQESIVIVPPGAYSTNGIISIKQELQGTVVYAYGVYQEYAEQNYDNYVSNQLYFADTSDVSVYGLTIGYAIPSSGQIRVVEKYIEADGNKYDDVSKVPSNTLTRAYRFTVIPDAGFWEGFTKTDPELFHTWWPEMFLLDENGNYKYYCDENPKSSHNVVKNDDGTMTVTLTTTGSDSLIYGENKGARYIWERVLPGTILTCRLSGGNRLSVCVSNSKNITLKDVTVYGYAAAFAAYANGQSENINFIRFHDTTHTGAIIDKETYEKYAALEEKWNVDFEISEEKVNGETRYRGAPSRSSSVDAFHITGTTTGVNITSSIVESMVDDASNQHSASSRLHHIEYVGDVAYIYYKDTATGVNWGNISNGGTLSPSSTANFGKGDKIYVYAPDGRTVCDTVTLSEFSYVESIEDTITVGSKTGKLTTRIFKVAVPAGAINKDALINPDTGAQYELSDNHYSMTNKVTVDNLTQNACSYTIDNMLVRNAHSRGFLVKSRDVTIKHCTFRNVSYNAILIRSETEWAESTIAKNILIQQCLFDNTGFIFNDLANPDQACIRIQGTSDQVSEDTLPIDNITITGCKFTNNRQKYAIWVNSAKNVKITDNTFDPIVNDFLTNQTGTAVFLDVCMNVEISDNTYKYENYTGDITKVIVGRSKDGINKYSNIFGTDVTDADGNHIFSDK